jgi:NAD+ diphosphatase
VSFLREDHSFLSAAVKHPTTRFLIFKDLRPLVSDTKTVVYASYDEVKELIGEDPFAKEEEERSKEYDSSITIPQIVFLGVDEENKDGLNYKIYTGAPYFALDVTPKGSVEAVAKKLCNGWEAKGLKFLEGRVHMSFPAPEGTQIPH